MLNRKIRVLNVLHSFGRGGAETLLLSLLNTHDKVNFEWAVCGLFQSTRPSILSEFKGKGIKYYNINTPSWKMSLSHPIKSLGQYIDLSTKFLDVCKDFHPDVIHSHLFMPSFVSNILFAHTNVGLVTTFHNTVFAGGIYKYWLQKLSVLHARPVCIGCSEAATMANLANGMIPKSLSISVPNGVNTHDFDPEHVSLPENNPFAERPDCLHILQVGNLESRKGYEYTIKAAEILKNKDIPILICCAGIGIERENYERQAQQAGVIDNIRFLGPRKDVKNLLKAADLFIMPSLYEGLSIAMLEAMSMGLPVVASSVGGAPEVIEDGKSGILIDPGDAEALASQIILLADNKELRKQIGEKARVRVISKYSLRSQASTLENIYHTVVKKKTKKRS